MKNKVVKGMVSALCLAMAVSTAVVTLPANEMVVEAAASSETPGTSETPGQSGNSGSTKTPEELLAEAKTDALAALRDHQRVIDPGNTKKEELDKAIADATAIINAMESEKGVTDYVTKTLLQMDNIINPPKEEENTDEEDEEEEEEPDPVTADSFLRLGGSWTTPTINPGQTLMIALPVVNMGKTMVKNAVVTPVLSTDVNTWPFEISELNYTQTIADLPGTDSGISDMDRRREIGWNLTARSDIGSGYQKISFDIRYEDAEGHSQSETLDTYVKLNGTAGVSADGQASVPRVIVTGFETDPETVHAGESFMLTLHLKNTSTATSVSNMIFEIKAAVEGKDEDTTYEAFLPTAGSSTIFVDRIEKNGTRDIQIELEAKADLTQKPYAVNVNMSYEDEHVNAYTNTSSVSIPVKQEARVDVSAVEVMPDSINVGDESNVMFSIYNMGKTKLYNVQVKTDNPSVSGDAFVGNLDSGATGSVDMYLIGQQATQDDGTITLQISYEDETGAVTTMEKDITLFVSEAFDDMAMDGYYPEDDMMMDDASQTAGPSTLVVVVIVVIVLAAAAAAVIVLRRRKKKKQQKLEEDLMDLDDDDTEL